MHKELLLVCILLVSACTTLQGTVGSDVIKVQSTETYIGVKDLLSIGEIKTIPKSPVPPNTPIALSFILQNNDDTVPLEKVKKNLFDAPGFSGVTADNTKTLCNSNPDNCFPRDNMCTDRGGFCIILPLEQKEIIYNLTTPSTAVIKSVGSEVTLSFLASYEVESSSQFVFPVVDFEEIKKQQAGSSTVTVPASATHGRGPLVVDMEVVGSPYVLSTYPGRLAFRVRNAGGGEVVSCGTSTECPGLRGRTVKMQIEFPKGMTVTPPTGFTSVGDYMYENIDRDITFVNKESAGSIIFPFDPINIAGKPFISEPIKVTLTYFYEIRGSAPIRIQPV
ncbi:MAG: hypothetical protein HY832_03980 [Candidatus Aenigmarchaeota archaeon]|nr:hypothetical protein [Candidatus Aenigmarchaeota archaeon]